MRFAIIERRLRYDEGRWNQQLKRPFVSCHAMLAVGATAALPLSLTVT